MWALPNELPNNVSALSSSLWPTVCQLEVLKWIEDEWF